MGDDATLPFPGKHPAFIIRQREPFNGGPPLGLLCRSLITPGELFFVRNHGTIPEVDPNAYRLVVDGLARRPLRLSLDDLRALPAATVTATLECAGNRRDELIAVAPVPGETPWGAEAVGTAVWRGVPLREVLAAAGVAEGARHVAFLGLDEVVRKGEQIGFGGSVPLEKALNPEVLLAYEMNGEPLPPTHGFPLRVVVPGYIGARSVKWLSSVTLQATPSSHYFQAHAYKLFPPQECPETVNWAGGIMLGELSVNAVICQPAPGAAIPAGQVLIEGYAFAGGNRCVERVDVSADGGETWVVAELPGEHVPWTWRLWRARLDLRPGSYRLVARAWDSAANTQPENLRSVWNFKGYMNNAWHRVEVEVRG